MMPYDYHKKILAQYLQPVMRLKVQKFSLLGKEVEEELGNLQDSGVDIFKNNFLDNHQQARESNFYLIKNNIAITLI